jgi:hypothetical protein
MGQTVPIELDLNDAFDTRLDFTARVRWCAPALAEGFTVAGLEFVGFQPESSQRERFERFLARLAENPDSYIA